MQGTIFNRGIMSFLREKARLKYITAADLKCFTEDYQSGIPGVEAFFKFSDIHLHAEFPPGRYSFKLNGSFTTYKVIVFITDSDLSDFPQISLGDVRYWLYCNGVGIRAVDLDMWSLP